MADSKSRSNVVTNFFRNNGRLVRYGKGESIIATDTPECIYLIEKGHVKVYSINKDGEKFLHIVYRNREIFPVFRVIKNMQRDAYFEALDHVLVWRVTPGQLNAFVNGSVEAATSVLSVVLEQFAVYADRVDNLEYKRASERLAYHLLFLAYRFGQKVDDYIVLEATFTQQDIGNSINMARESVSREFERLEKTGAVELTDHKIIIRDVNYLSEMLGESFDPEIWNL